MSDLIDRQAVLDTIHLFFTEEIDKIPTKKTEDGEVYVIHKCQPLFEMNKAICKRIKALSSASPTQNCVGNALDCISRQAVFEVIKDYASMLWEKYHEPFPESTILEMIQDLPSVTPTERTGHWKRVSIDKYVQHAMAYYRCSECGKDIIGEHNYCPNCGARMAGDN